MSAAALIAMMLFPAPWLWGALGLLAAVHIFLSALGLSVSAGEFCLISGLLMAAPLAAWLTGRLLDDFTCGVRSAGSLSALAAALAFSLLIDSGLLAGALRAVLQILAGGSWQKQFMLVGAIGNAVVLCAALTAFVLMVLVLLIELPFVWFARRDRSGTAAAIAAFRPLLVVLGLCLVFNHVSGLFVEELAPMMLIRSAWGG